MVLKGQPCPKKWRIRSTGTGVTSGDPPFGKRLLSANAFRTSLNTTGTPPKGRARHQPQIFPNLVTQLFSQPHSPSYFTDVPTYEINRSRQELFAT